jgi:hypothetical protein
MTDIKKLLESIDQLTECPPMEGGAMPPAPMDQGDPVRMNVNISAAGKDHVADLIDMMKNAGLGDAKPVDAKMLSPRLDMERLRGIVDEPEMEADEVYADAADEEVEEWDNEPDPEYQDHEYMTKDLSGGLNREKKAYAKAQDGDNAMAVEAIKAQLMAALEEKKAKPDYIDIDGDGDKEEPMKKAVKDKKAKKED